MSQNNPRSGGGDSWFQQVLDAGAGVPPSAAFCSPEGFLELSESCPGPSGLGNSRAWEGNSSRESRADPDLRVPPGVWCRALGGVIQSPEPSLGSLPRQGRRGWAGAAGPELSPLSL